MTTNLQHFALGRLLITPAARDALTPDEVGAALRRHAQGDWGDVPADDWKANDEALKEGTRLFSAYHGRDGTKFWIVTEANRQATTVLLPDDY